jgi:hypothetical protein
MDMVKYMEQQLLVHKAFLETVYQHDFCNEQRM